MRKLAISLIAMAISSCAHAPVSGPVATPNGAIDVDDGGRGGLPVLFIHGNGAIRRTGNRSSRICAKRAAR
jgi:hypothetical protein